MNGYAGAVNGYAGAVNGYAGAGGYAEVRDGFAEPDFAGSAAYLGPGSYTEPGAGRSDAGRHLADPMLADPMLADPCWRLPTPVSTRTAGRPTGISGGKRADAGSASAR